MGILVWSELIATLTYIHGNWKWRLLNPAWAQGFLYLMTNWLFLWVWMCISRAGSWVEHQSSCFYWSNTHTHRDTHLSSFHPPPRQSRSPTLALPQDMRGSCVSQAKSWSSPHPPPHFLPLHSWFSASAQSRGTLGALKGYWTPPPSQSNPAEQTANCLQRKCTVGDKEGERGSTAEARERSKFRLSDTC